ncbi:radical SAM family heme chaperone HemW [Pelobium manganitolerans]|uniref:radical SAM family heme chaperone HemW n=1 Tax=Pelobium manganitolerans TaxID=1842495 RepID=UPI003FA3795D
MAGIYIHIPFCKQACHYCDFHFITSLKRKTELLDSVRKEISLQKNYLQNQTVETIYFGGGTPSLLSADEIKSLLSDIYSAFNVSGNPEATLEANPDDLNAVKLKELHNAGINRLSIGVQSFFDEDLVWMNRAHKAQEAEASIKRAQDIGIENISVDLIYGFPLLSDEKWQHNVQKLINFEVPHISSYSMTVEARTALANFIRKKQQKAMDDAQSAQQFSYLIDALKQAGFEHYEISNFAKPERYSQHNTNYWLGVHYLGLGPSAHSFNGTSRQWNVANNAQYLSAIAENKIPFELELLSKADVFNEYVMTSLRTQWGLDLQKITTDFGKATKDNLLAVADEYRQKNWLLIDEDKVKLSAEGKLYADLIASELFITEDGF